MPASEAIQKLAENFSTHIEHYKSAGYNETELRREYLDPFWKALGWDIDNEQGYADAYKDVIHEDAIKSTLPIRPIDFDNPAEVAQHDKMVTLVERMLDLHKQKAGETNPNTRKQLETQITATDRQIDRLVYQLYELIDEEIALVEQSG